MNAARAIARLGLQEALRRRVFLIVALLTVAYLILYGLGTWQAFESTQGESVQFRGVEADVVAGATLLGLNMFGTLFLGTILAVFLTLGAVRGDAERGLLQPLLVRPVPRRTLLAARFASAALVCGAYVIVVFLIATVITWALGGWWPDRTLEPAIGLAAAVAILCALSLAGSVFLASTANGIAVFMVFGAGLVAGLLGQIGEALGSNTLSNVATTASWILPFEALYQSALGALTTDTVGFTRLAIDLGPFGGAEDFGPLLWPWAIVYLGARRRARPEGVRAPRPLRLEPVVDLQRRALDGVRRLRLGGLLDAQRRGQLAGLVHLRDDVAAADQLALDEQLGDRRPVGDRGELLADARVGEDVDGGVLRAEGLEGRRGARGEPAHRPLGRALHEEDDLVVSDRVLDGVADGVLGHVHSALVSRERAWMGPPMSAPNTA